MNYHNCEFVKVDDNTFTYYYGTKENYSASVIIKRIHDKWYYEKPLGFSSSYNDLQECIDFAYKDMLSSKL